MVGMEGAQESVMPARGLWQAAHVSLGGNKISAVSWLVTAAWHWTHAVAACLAWVNFACVSQRSVCTGLVMDGDPRRPGWTS